MSFLNLVKQLLNYKLKALTGRFVSGGSHEFFSVSLHCQQALAMYSAVTLRNNKIEQKTWLTSFSLKAMISTNLKHFISGNVCFSGFFLGMRYAMAARNCYEACVTL